MKPTWIVTRPPIAPAGGGGRKKGGLDPILDVQSLCRVQTNAQSNIAMSQLLYMCVCVQEGRRFCRLTSRSRACLWGRM